MSLDSVIRLSFIAYICIASIHTSIASSSSSQDYTPPSATRLATDAEHKNFLIGSLNSARKSVMISSYDVSPTIFKDGIAQSIVNAAKRGIQVYIYFEHEARCTDKEHRDLSDIARLCARFEVNCNHSKCVIKDKDTVAIGSYNWLSHFNDTSSNATVVTTGALASRLKDDVWQGMRFYQCLQNDNEKGIANHCADGSLFLPKQYEISNQSCVTLLRSPEAHSIFLKQVFDSAQSNIFMFSPFIKLSRLQDTFTPAVLRSLNVRDIRTILVTLPSPCKNPVEQSKIFTLLDDLQRNYPCFSYQIRKDFHAKTLVSDNIICEGSLNWLSAVSETAHEANNYEVSVAIKGEFAANLLKGFYERAIGQSITPPAPHDVGLSQSLTAQASVIKPSAIPASFDKHIKIFSGAKFGKQGFCVKLDADYLRDERNSTIYFASEAEAKQAAYDRWAENNSVGQSVTKMPEKKREREQTESPVHTKPKKNNFIADHSPKIPREFDNLIKIYSGATFGNAGFCVKLEGRYIVNRENQILYYSDRDEARQAAYDVWMSKKSNNRRAW